MDLSKLSRETAHDLRRAAVAANAEGVLALDGQEVADFLEGFGNVRIVNAHGSRFCDEFSRIFDGFSIGSNDLTQLTLGVDRDSATVAFEFDERDPGVRKMLKLAIEGCQRNRRHSGICGQAPSDYPEIAAELVRLGIDSISVNPDVIIKTTVAVLALEHELSAPERRAAG